MFDNKIYLYLLFMINNHTLLRIIGRVKAIGDTL